MRARPGTCVVCRQTKSGMQRLGQVFRWVTPNVDDEGRGYVCYNCADELAATGVEIEQDDQEETALNNDDIRAMTDDELRDYHHAMRKYVVDLKGGAVPVAGALSLRQAEERQGAAWTEIERRASEAS